MAEVDQVYSEVPYVKRGAKATNTLLVRSQTGKPKTATYELPSADFVYGEKYRIQEEGAKEILYSWKEHIPNPDAIPGKDFVSLNKAATIEGFVSATLVKDYRKNHDVRLKQGPSLSNKAALKPVIKMPLAGFGQAKHKQTDHIADLLSNQFQREYIVNQNKKSEAIREEKKTIAPVPTKASRGHALGAIKLNNSNDVSSSGKKEFVMKQFQNIPSKVKSLGYFESGRATATTTSDNNNTNSSTGHCCAHSTTDVVEEEKKQQQQQHCDDFAHGQCQNVSVNSNYNSQTVAQQTAKEILSASNHAGRTHSAKHAWSPETTGLR